MNASWDGWAPWRTVYVPEKAETAHRQAGLLSCSSEQTKWKARFRSLCVAPKYAVVQFRYFSRTGISHYLPRGSGSMHAMEILPVIKLDAIGASMFKILSIKKNYTKETH